MMIFKPISCAIAILIVATALTGCNEKEAVFKPAVSVLIRKADELHKAGQLNQAICRLEAASDIAPQTFEVQYNLGILYTEAKLWEPAATHLEQAAKINPSQYNTFFSLGYAYRSWADSLLPHPAENAVSPPTQSPAMSSKTLELYQKAVFAYDTFLKNAPR